MDALKFLKERKRMCSCYKHCEGCPLESINCALNAADEEYKQVIAAVEQWSKKHPRRTRQSIFLEQFPETTLDVTGVITICPIPLSGDYRNDNRGCKHPDTACYDCRRDFWMQEVDDTER